MRYRLLPYIATAFAAAAATGKPVARPLWFEYPTDSTAAGIDRQWLLGGDILISPVLEQVCNSLSWLFTPLLVRVPMCPRQLSARLKARPTFYFSELVVGLPADRAVKACTNRSVMAIAGCVDSLCLLP